jgi:NAD-dependent SIR2 family protein deacetylase
MNNELYEQISKIREARLNDKLVIFVGSGVSDNSGVGTWGVLIKKLSEIIKYKKGRRKTDKFSSEEYLKIPQYVFNHSKKKYKAALKDEFGAKRWDSVKPNAIDEIVFQLNPSHIITTNYDPLLENALDFRRPFYTVIAKDTDMLTKSKTSKKFLIKMHGDYTSIEEGKIDEIVLKEDDYLNYENNFSLISTFIKSLLVTHTFLFVGYSMNDNNLKMIINWVENLAKDKETRKKMQNSYIINTDEKIESYDRQYFANKHIDIIKAAILPVDWIYEVKKNNKFEKLEGELTYAVLSAVLNDISDVYLLPDITDVLKERYKIFDEMNFIAYEDLLRAFDWNSMMGNKGRTNIDSLVLPSDKTDAVYESFYLDFHIPTEDYDKRKAELQKIFCDKDVLKYYFRANILFISAVTDEQQDDIDRLYNSTYYYNDDFKNELEMFELYWQNDYIQLAEKIDAIPNWRAKAYWLSQIGDYDRVNELNEQNVIKVSNGKLKFWDVVDKLNVILQNKKSHHSDNRNKGIRKELKFLYSQSTNNEKMAFEYLYHNIFEANTLKETLSCIKFLEKHQLDYNSGGMWKSDPCDNLRKIFLPVFCYYKFIKYNYIDIDVFTDTTDLFWAFSRAVLYTYKFRKISNNNFLGTAGTEFPKLKIDSISLDIIVKYSDYKKLRNFVNEHNLKEFVFNNDCNVTNKFLNLCRSLSEMPRDYFEKYLENLCLLLRRSVLSDEQKTDIANILNAMIHLDSPSNGYRNYFDRLINIKPNQNFDLLYEIKQLLICVLMPNNYSFIIEYLDAIKDQDAFANYAKDVFRKTDIKELKICISKKCENNFDVFSPLSLYDLYIYGVVKKGDIIIKKIQDDAVDSLQVINNHPKGFYSDGLNAQAVNAVLMLTELYFRGDIDISVLEVNKDLSIYLQFILSDDFDVSQIDTNDHNWQHILNNVKMIEKIINNPKMKTDFADKIKKTVYAGNATEFEKRLYYKYFEATTP